MDATRDRSPSRYGAGLRSGEMAARADEMVEHLGARSPWRCPYGLGASCTLGEIASGARLKTPRYAMFLHVAAIAVGVVVTIIAVRLIYF